MHYTLHQLQVFLKVAQFKSITKASEELNMTQPAVSIQLKNLQNQFDIPITEVQGRQLYVTDFGKEILEMAERIVNEMSAINNKTMAHKGYLSGRLKISSVSTGKYIIPYFLSEFIKNQAGIELILDVTNKSKVINSLENNEVDFALVSVLPKKLPIEKIDLMPNKLYVVGNMERKFKKGIYDKKIFNELPIIFREEGSGTRVVMEKFIAKNKLPIHKKMELTSNEAVKQAVIAGLGFSIMPLIGIKNELLNKDLQIVNLKDFPIKTTWHLIWLKNKKFSPVAEAYLKYVKTEKHRIIKEKFDWFDKY
ncbi:MAG: LysR family transcriptional regulator [Bacteroidota bacterium]|nr:LysR family transcriptional regulator [Bacteroidota bacterium]MDP3145543.1 LysR family transcriptional regulator [Bacteroidota bacterium]MDP3557988.1 LysR family transcriptional regulator [Bacteroidota bacterium]